jgi:hypothetical protein
LCNSKVRTNLVLLEVNLIVPNKQPYHPIENNDACFPTSTRPPTADKEGKVCSLKPG